MNQATTTRTADDLQIVARIDESGREVALSPQQERFNSHQVSDMVDNGLARLREIALVRRANREAAASVAENPALAAALSDFSSSLGRTWAAPMAKAA